MTKEDFLYALENENLIHLERDEDTQKILVEETLENRDCETWCRLRHWERLDIKTIVRIIDEIWGFDD